MEGERETETDRQTDRQTDKQTDRQTDRIEFENSLILQDSSDRSFWTYITAIPLLF